MFLHGTYTQQACLGVYHAHNCKNLKLTWGDTVCMHCRMSGAPEDVGLKALAASGVRLEIVGHGAGDMAGKNRISRWATPKMEVCGDVGIGLNYCSQNGVNS